MSEIADVRVVELSTIRAEFNDEHNTTSAEYLLAASLAIAQYFNELFPGDTKPANIEQGLRSITSESRNLEDNPDSTNAKTMLLMDLQYYSSLYETI